MFAWAMPSEWLDRIRLIRGDRMMGFRGAAPFRTRACALGGAICSILQGRKAVVLAVTLCGVFVVGPSPQARSADLHETLSADGRLELFAKAVRETGLSNLLTEAGPFTLFVPSDRALADEGSAFLLERVLLTESNSERLTDLVEHHIAASTRLVPNRPVGVEVTTLSGPPIRIDSQGSARIVDGRAVVTDHAVADNGVIYVVDRLLWPRDWQSGQDVVDLDAQLQAMEHQPRGVAD
ncbi:MAG TPA: fasciclin domain-containing protein [Kiloniellales bacterium]|nr:fasciclin domain-containing protein [Kiloniellales bacterium]